jgi:hypothetical protein
LNQAQATEFKQINSIASAAAGEIREYL